MGALFRGSGKAGKIHIALLKPVKAANVWGQIIGAAKIRGLGEILDEEVRCGGRPAELVFGYPPARGEKSISVTLQPRNARVRAFVPDPHPKSMAPSGRCVSR